ncbi:MAG TPA: PilZ domain-containing protein [Candidatus Acidoferrales bacterium]|nr:PilZ domain-containing protein [Candidatus Acidoferrales bacterium]
MKSRGTGTVLNKDYLVTRPDAGARYAERRCVPRYPFIAAVEVFEPVSRTSLEARITEISTRGCYIDTQNPMPMNSVIQIRIVRDVGKFETWGRVAYSQEGLGMGIAFLQTAPDQQKIIDSWVAEISGE